jgi:GTP-binding protein YchF
VKKSAKGSAAKEAEVQINVLQKVYDQLQTNQPVRTLELNEDEQKIVAELHLLTMKPMMYVVNVVENSTLKAENGKTIIDPATPQVEVCAQLEAELAELSPEEAREYLRTAGIEQTGLDKIITAGYKLLNLVTYFTSGEPETRAWTITMGTKAPDAAGVIHTDFIKGFIKADVIGWEDFIALGGWNKAKESGKVRLEGKEYVVKDGEVVYFYIA